MSLSIKSGVRVHGLSTPIVLAIIVAEGVFRELGHDLTLTAGIDGKHSAGSSHYAGNAVDLRSRILPEGVAPKACAMIQERLGPDYFAQVEVDHIHIQYRPQNAYSI